MSFRDKVLKNQAILDGPEDVELAIEEAKTLKRINELRTSLVQAMKIKPYLLKKWQDKYWALKKCQSCGQLLDES